MSLMSSLDEKKPYQEYTVFYGIESFNALIPLRYSVFFEDAIKKDEFSTLEDVKTLVKKLNGLIQE